MKFKPLKGMKDFLPAEMILRQRVIEKIKTIFENFGFQPLETPALESWEVLAAKGAGGEEILKETYSFEDRAGRKIGLRYDLTVPLARVIAQNPDLPLPFKRYQIQKVWRYGDVAKGRLREFLQCDIDIVGSASMLADAEVIACAIACLKALGFEGFVVRLNNRKILNALVKYAGIEEAKVLDVLRSIDKLEKIGREGVEKELKEKRIPEKSIEKIFELIEIKGKPNEIFERVSRLIEDFEEGMEGINELKELIAWLELMKCSKYIKVDLSLARGLDYYTGPIFEFFAEKGIGSIAAGGRYDKLIGLFAKRNLPATGASLGIERIIEVIKDRKLIKVRKCKTKVFVACASDEVRENALEIVFMLRENGIQTDFDLRGRNLTRQLKYADSLGIPYVIIVGKKELEAGRVKIRRMEEEEEAEIKIHEILKFFEKGSLG
ncbi:MAG: histidine--tRNA ligase [Candidatus Aenigmatarchaeota archaeon]|nr:MAG: histidine--tRNA ligase [Candidatus Aenigmarchaeota archaeon]